jgi:ABC-type multidrug transport system permease subunit
VFGALYLFARDKLNVWEILGFSIVSILLGSLFFSKYFLKATASMFPGAKNPFPTYYLEGSEKEVASANAVLFGVPVGVFLTNVAVLFGLFYGYVSISNKF